MAGNTFLKTMDSVFTGNFECAGSATEFTAASHADQAKRLTKGRPQSSRASDCRTSRRKKNFRVGRCTGYAPIVHSFSTTGFYCIRFTLPIMRFLAHAAALGLSIAAGAATAAGAVGHALPDIEVPRRRRMAPRFSGSS